MVRSIRVENPLDPVQPTTAIAQEQSPREGLERWALRYFWPLMAGLVVVRLIAATRSELVPDEAVYWAWSRHLSAGYFDHPPMIALLNWASTHVLGNVEMAVRLPAILLSLGSLAVLAYVASELFRDARAVGFFVLMWAASPLLAVLGMISTPDPPATFFSVCALACAVLIADQDDRGTAQRSVARLWLWFAFFTGLALVSKYTAILVPGGVGLALLTSRQGWRHLRQPWVYLAALVALVVFSPVIWWNATHHWASFVFQLHHGAADSATGPRTLGGLLLARAVGLGGFLAGQALVWTPVLFGVSVVVLGVYWMRLLAGLLAPAMKSEIRSTKSATNSNLQSGKTTKQRPFRFPRVWLFPVRILALFRISRFEFRASDRILLWCGTLPLVFFGWAAMRTRGEINWPAFAYFPISLLIARYLTENWRGRRVEWVRGGCHVAIGFMVALYLLLVPGVPWALQRLHVPLPHSVTDLHGWRMFGGELADAAHGAPVVCNRHQDAAEASFYMPGQPDVWCDGVGFRPTAYDYFDDPPDFQRIRRVLFVGGHFREFMEKHGYTHAEPLTSLTAPGTGKYRNKAAAMISR